MIITHKSGRGKKIHIMIDDEYRITTDSDFWAEHCIKDGTDIDDTQWEELVDSINYKKAINKCYDLLSRRDHSVKELRQKLLRTSDEKNSDRAIEKMLEYGYLDDEKYAEKLLAHLLQNKKMSRAFIKQEMYKRGLSQDIISITLQDIEIDNIPTIIDLINTKYRNKMQAENGREKVIQALMRKGFSYGDIKSALSLIENDEYV